MIGFLTPNAAKLVDFGVGVEESDVGLPGDAVISGTYAVPSQSYAYKYCSIIHRLTSGGSLQ